MFKVNNYLMYKRDVCIVKEIKEKYIRDRDYYLLVPINDESLKIEVPVDSKLIRELIDKQRVYEIIQNIPNIPVIEIDKKKIEDEYKKLLMSGKHEDLIKIIKTAYLRNRERIDNNKKTTDKDNYYFELAERYLYYEFMIVMEMDYEAMKKYVNDMVAGLVK